MRYTFVKQQNIAKIYGMFRWNGSINSRRYFFDRSLAQVILLEDIKNWNPILTGIFHADIKSKKGGASDVMPGCLNNNRVNNNTKM